MRAWILSLPLLLAATALPASEWRVVPEESTLGFRGTQSGQPFEGRFTRWSAEIRLDPAVPAAGTIRVTVDPVSADAGSTERNGPLPGADWFAVEQHPEAVFQSTAIRSLGGDRYEAAGTLTMKGVSQPVTLPFTLAITGDRAEADGATTILRTDWGIGAGRWANPDWVGTEVEVFVDLTAMRQGG